MFEYIVYVLCTNKLARAVKMTTNISFVIYCGIVVLRLVRSEFILSLMSLIVINWYLNFLPFNVLIDMKLFLDLYLLKYRQMTSFCNKYNVMAGKKYGHYFYFKNFGSMEVLSNIYHSNWNTIFTSLLPHFGNPNGNVTITLYTKQLFSWYKYVVYETIVIMI